MNFLLIVLLLVAGAVALFFVFGRKAQGIDETAELKKSIKTLDDLTKDVKDTFDNILQTNYAEMNLNAIETEKAERNKIKLRRNLKSGKFGNLAAKYYVRNYIADLLQRKYKLTTEMIQKLFPYNEPSKLSAMDKFDILLYIYQKKYNLDAAQHFFEDNNLDRGIPSVDGTGDIHYEVSRKDIEYVFRKHKSLVDALNYTDYISILSQRIYQETYGNGVIDDLRDQNIDGISAGCGGVPSSFYEFGVDNTYGAPEGDLALASCNSIWMMFNGKKVNLSFMGFLNDKAIERVAKNIYRYNDPGTISRNHPYMVSDSQDGCRIVVLRPPMTPCWVFFVRKLGAGSRKSFETLYPHPGVEKLKETIKFLAKGNRNIAITGQQGTGKSTLLMSVCQFLRESKSIRTQEKAYELNLQKIYPKRNVVAIRETPDVSGQEGLNVQKKTDGDINLVGEVAEASVATWAIQTGQVGSSMTMFTHHAKTAYDLVTAFRNNMVESSGYDTQIAEVLVSQVLNFNIHVAINTAGDRYIERITEIIPVEHAPHPEKLQDCIKEFFFRITDRQNFKCVNILEGNPYEGYKWVNGFSDYQREQMKLSLMPNELAEFEDLCNRMDMEARLSHKYEGDQKTDKEQTPDELDYIDPELNLTELLGL